MGLHATLLAQRLSTKYTGTPHDVQALSTLVHHTTYIAYSIQPRDHTSVLADSGGDDDVISNSSGALYLFMIVK